MVRLPHLRRRRHLAGTVADTCAVSVSVTVTVTVPVTVPAPSPSPSPSPSPAPAPAPTSGLTNTLNAGVPGASLAIAGGSSGGSAFDAVSATSGASVTYDTTHTRGVGLSAKHVLAPGKDAYYEWNRSFGTQARWYGRVYVWFDALPGGDLRLIRARGNSTLRFAIDVMHGGQLRLKDGSNVTLAMTEPDRHRLLGTDRMGRGPGDRSDRGSSLQQPERHDSNGVHRVGDRPGDRTFDGHGAVRPIGK